LGESAKLTSLADGFRFNAYLAPAQDARRGGLVLVHEIFGVTDHIRVLADGFAAHGYETLAPSFFDRSEEGFAAVADASGVERGRRYSEGASWDQVALDIAAAVRSLKPPVFSVGYCWGGAAAWLAACRCSGLAAASGFYGRRIPELLGEAPLCPIMLHFGRRDPSIPPEVVEAISDAHPDIPIHIYEAGHGFASDRPADYSADPARLARLRTLQLFAINGGGRGDI
jgi:carboxymethylenebutenolidase